MKKKQTKTFVILLLVVLFLVIAPFVALRGAQFGGSDDAASQLVEQLDEGYEPWFTPLLETLTGGELPGEIENLLFCVQTGIGVGVLAFCFGYLVARKKYRG